MTPLRTAPIQAPAVRMHAPGGPSEPVRIVVIRAEEKIARRGLRAEVEFFTRPVDRKKRISEIRSEFPIRSGEIFP